MEGAKGNCRSEAAVLEGCVRGDAFFGGSTIRGCALCDPLRRGYVRGTPCLHSCRYLQRIYYSCEEWAIDRISGSAMAGIKPI